MSGKNNPFYGKKHTDQSKSIIGKKSKGRKFSQESRDKRSDKLKGRLTWSSMHPEEMSKKMQGNKGRTGQHTPEEVKKKTSNSVKLAHQRPEVKKKYADALEKTKYLGQKCDIGQPEFIAKWNTLGFNFEINYQIRIENEIFYLDGYDKQKNVVLEYDSKYHKKQKQKDLIRQNKVINFLNPKAFWRYDTVEKKLRNVLQESVG